MRGCHRVTPLLDPIPSEGVAFLPGGGCEASGSDLWSVDVTTVDGVVLMMVDAPHAKTSLSAHLTPEATRRLALDLLTAAVFATEKERER